MIMNRINQTVIFRFVEWKISLFSPSSFSSSSVSHHRSQAIFKREASSIIHHHSSFIISTQLQQVNTTSIESVSPRLVSLTASHSENSTSFSKGKHMILIVFHVLPHVFDKHAACDFTKNNLWIIIRKDYSISHVISALLNIILDTLHKHD